MAPPESHSGEFLGNKHRQQSSLDFQGGTSKLGACFLPIGAVAPFTRPKVREVYVANLVTWPNRSMGGGVSYVGFRPLEWRCTAQQRQNIAYRQILGRGAWVAGNVRINDDIRLSTLPLTFSIQVGREGADRFGRLQYNPVLKDEIVQDSPARLHVDLNITVHDFQDLWTRGPDRVPHRLIFEVEGLRNDDRIWDLDVAQYAMLLIVSYAFENVTIDGGSTNATDHGRDKLWDALWQRLDKLKHKINFIGDVAIALFASVITSSILLFGLAEKSFGQIGMTMAVVVSPLAWIIIFATLRSILNKHG